MSINWKKELFTIPNMLSMFRLILIPVYTTIYLNAQSNDQYFVAGMILAVSCMTDMIDGKIARRFNMVTNVGKLLDPMADKLTQLALTVCLSMRYPILVPVLLLFLVKEFFQLFAVIIQYRRGKALDGALLSGKICTAVLFVSLIIMVLFPNLPNAAVYAFALTDGCLLAVTFVHYIFAFFGKHSKVRDINKN